MKPDRWGIFQVPIDYNRKKTYEDFSITTQKEEQKPLVNRDHVRWYGADYKDRLERGVYLLKTNLSRPLQKQLCKFVSQTMSLSILQKK